MLQGDAASDDDMMTRADERGKEQLQLQLQLKKQQYVTLQLIMQPNESGGAESGKLPLLVS